jgi:hypothetical protein
MIISLFLFENEFLNIVAISFTALILNELIMVALEITTWHIYMIIAEIVTLGLYVISMALLPEFFGVLPSLGFLCLRRINLYSQICHLYFLPASRGRSLLWWESVHYHYGYSKSSKVEWPLRRIASCYDLHVNRMGLRAHIWCIDTICSIPSPHPFLITHPREPP